MGGISVCNKGLRASQITTVSELVVRSALDILKEVFESIPVLWTRIGIEVSEICDGVGNVRVCHHGKVLE